MFMVRASIISIILLSLLGCSATRVPIPAGQIPELKPVSAEDEQFGHQVLNSLSQQYPLESEPGKVQPVRDIVDRLSSAINAQNEPWHVYILKGDVQNAGATRGNHLFIWSGMLDILNDDTELATVLAHEIGHILAEHPTPNSAEQTRQTLTGVAGQITKEVLASQGSIGVLAGLAQIMVQQTLGALIINPESQRKELEADIIGLHLMAEAGFDPSSAINFWSRTLSDKRFSSSPIEFLSSHPSSTKRLENLSKQLDAAMLRYQSKWGSNLKSSSEVIEYNPPLIGGVNFKNVPVYQSANRSSPIIGQLKLGEQIDILKERGDWLKINSLHSGYILKGQVRYIKK